MTAGYPPIRSLKIAVIREEFIALTGDLEKSVLLNQLIYWTKRVHDFDQMLAEEEKAKESEGKSINVKPRHGWIFKTAGELLDETMLNCSESTIRRKLRELIDKGWIEDRQNPENSWDKRRQFRCNLVKLQTDLFELGYSLQGFSHTLKKPQKTACVSGDGSNAHSDRSNERHARSYKDKETTSEITSSSLSPSWNEVEIFEEEEEKNLIQMVEEKKDDIPSVIDQAMGIWNRLIIKDGLSPRLSPSLRARLERLLEQTFQNDLEEWQRLCEKIASNSFLMGGGERGWRASLEWLADETHALNVLEDKYWSHSLSKEGEKGLSIKSIKADLVRFNKDLQAHCDKQCDDQRWYGICETLVKKIGVDAFKSWFWNLASVRFKGKVLELVARTAFEQSALKQRFLSDLKAAARSFNLEAIHILEKEEGLS